MKYYLAIDIGASSGRHIIGKVLNNKLIDTVEIYRFKNQMSFKNGHYIWDIDNLFKEIKNGIKIAIKEYKTIESMSIDTWGVDYALLDKYDNLIGDIYAYRDERTLDDIDYVHNIISFNVNGCNLSNIYSTVLLLTLFFLIKSGYNSIDKCFANALAYL